MWGIIVFLKVGIDPKITLRYKSPQFIFVNCNFAGDELQATEAAPHPRTPTGPWLLWLARVFLSMTQSLTVPGLTGLETWLLVRVWFKRLRNIEFSSSQTEEIIRGRAGNISYTRLDRCIYVVNCFFSLSQKTAWYSNFILDMIRWPGTS